MAVKPQLACFERFGWPGYRALAEICEAARSSGLLVIADGKRGDVPVSARPYAEATIGHTVTPFGDFQALGADAMTVNPLLGEDALETFVDVAEEAGAGLFALVRTSNPGAADIQDLDVGGRPLFEQLAGMVDRFSDRLKGSTSGLSGMGAVTGATEPRHLARLRELMPTSIFLIPGVGAQGGDPGMLGAAFGPGPASALVAASRSIAGNDDPASAADELRDAVWTVSQA